MSHPRRPLVSLVTDRRRRGLDHLHASIVAAARAGVDIIQIRERDLDDRSLFALVTRAVAEAPQARVVVNDRLDVALASGAAGVHLRADSAPVGDVRRIAGTGLLVGRSVHHAEEAIQIAREGGCDYLLFGTVFPSGSKPAGYPVAGAAGLARVCEAVRSVDVELPVLAIGGVSVAEVAAVAKAGAAGFAAIGMFSDVTDMTGLMSEVRRRFDS